MSLQTQYSGRISCFSKIITISLVWTLIYHKTYCSSLGAIKINSHLRVIQAQATEVGILQIYVREYYGEHYMYTKNIMYLLKGSLISHFGLCTRRNFTCNTATVGANQSETSIPSTRHLIGWNQRSLYSDFENSDDCIGNISRSIRSDLTSLAPCEGTVKFRHTSLVNTPEHFEIMFRN